MKVKLTYFKRSGKYYTEGEYESSATGMYSLVDEIRSAKEHPGLIGRWNEGPIHVLCDADWYFPILLMPGL